MAHNTVRKILVRACVLGLLLSLALGWILFLLSEHERQTRQHDQGAQFHSGSGPTPPKPREVVPGAVGQDDLSIYKQSFDEGTDNQPFFEGVAPTFSVGQGRGDLTGNDDKVIQAGIDLLAGMGGGTLRILPGVYVLRNGIVLRPKVNLVGSGSDTILVKADGVSTPLVQDADMYESAIVVEDASGFAPGFGIMIQSRKEGIGGMSGLRVSKAIVSQVVGQVIHLNRRLKSEQHLAERARATNSFALLAGENIEGVRIEGLVLDGNGEANEYVDGNIAGAVYLKGCANITFRDVVARNHNGDGFSLQVCRDLVLDSCSAENNAKFGFHLGAGSIRTALTNCVSRSNGGGIYFCYGITQGVLEGCTLTGNQEFGISIGYRDTGNLIRDCTITENGDVGILFRRKQRDFEGGHRNLIVSSSIQDNGPQGKGVGIVVPEHYHDLVFAGNCIGDTGNKRQTVGIRIHPDARGIVLQENQFFGLATNVDSSQSLRERAKELLGR